MTNEEETGPHPGKEWNALLRAFVRGIDGNDDALAERVVLARTAAETGLLPPKTKPTVVSPIRERRLDLVTEANLVAAIANSANPLDAAIAAELIERCERFRRAPGGAVVAALLRAGRELPENVRTAAVKLPSVAVAAQSFPELARALGNSSARRRTTGTEDAAAFAETRRRSPAAARNALMKALRRSGAEERERLIEAFSEKATLDRDDLAELKSILLRDPDAGPRRAAFAAITRMETTTEAKAILEAVAELIPKGDELAVMNPRLNPDELVAGPRRDSPANLVDPPPGINGLALLLSLVHPDHLLRTIGREAKDVLRSLGGPFSTCGSALVRAAERHAARKTIGALHAASRSLDPVLLVAAESLDGKDRTTLLAWIIIEKPEIIDSIRNLDLMLKSLGPLPEKAFVERPELREACEKLLASIARKTPERGTRHGKNVESGRISAAGLPGKLLDALAKALPPNSAAARDVARRKAATVDPA
jgi:hypothetical protein